MSYDYSSLVIYPVAGFVAHAGNSSMTDFHLARSVRLALDIVYSSEHHWPRDHHGMMIDQFKPLACQRSSLPHVSSLSLLMRALRAKGGKVKDGNDVGYES